jgi:hypothetical protein
MTEPLYALTGRYAELQAMAEHGEDVSEALAQLDDTVHDKAKSIAKILAQLKGDAACARAESQRLAARAEAIEAADKKLREYVKDCMIAANIRSVKSPLVSITLSDGNPRVEVNDLEALPANLVRTKTTREADKVAIMKLHRETGEIPPGVSIVPTKTLTVR